MVNLLAEDHSHANKSRKYRIVLEAMATVGTESEHLIICCAGPRSRKVDEGTNKTHHHRRMKKAIVGLSSTDKGHSQDFWRLLRV